jgi:hypothetical protein
MTRGQTFRPTCGVHSELINSDPVGKSVDCKIK